MNPHLTIRAIEMDQDRSWMYQRLTRGLLTPGFSEKVKEFIQFALGHPICISEV